MPVKSLRSALFLAFSCLVTASVLYYIFLNISLEQVVELVMNADKGAILMFLVCSLSMSIFRTWRYAVLLSLSEYRPKSIPLFLTVLVRNFCADLLPARLGSAVYIFIVNTRLGIPLVSATSSFALALLFDALSIAPIIFVSVLLIGEDSLIPQGSILAISILVCLVSAVFIAALPGIMKIAARIVSRMSFLGATVKDFLLKALTGVNSDIQKIRDAGLYTRIFVLSLLVRAGKYSGLYFFLYALLRPKGYEFSDLPVSKVFIGFIVPEFAASLPISGIAGLGAYQGAWIFIFQLLGFPAEIAKVTSLSHHLFTQLYGYSLGLAALLMLLLLPGPGSDPRSAAPAVSSASAFYIRLGCTIMLFIVLLCAIHSIAVG